MKDRKNMVMVIIIGITISLFLCFNTTVFATTGTVITSDLRLRKEDNKSSEILKLLNENDQVEIISNNGEWYKVKVDGVVGYVSKQYIKVKEENIISNTTTTENNNTVENTTKPQEQQPTKPQENNKTEVNNTETKQVNISSETELKMMPLINSIAINTAKTTEKYDVISTVGVWSYITNGSKSGWVLTEKISKTQENNQSQENNQPQESTTNNNETQQSNQTQPETPQQQTQEPAKQKQEEKPASTEKIYSKSKTYYVKGTSVNVRSSASTSSQVVKSLTTNNSVKVIGEDGNWYIVEINGKKAYISKSLLSAKKIETTSRSSNTVTETKKTQTTPQVKEEPAKSVPSNPSGDAIVAYAKSFLGYRYVYGAAGPNAFDCSGFVQYVYKHFGYSLNRTATTQSKNGVAVSKSNLQPGDIIIFKNTAKTAIGHVGIYIGNNQFIHASNSRTGVIISSLATKAYQERYIQARRIL